MAQTKTISPPLSTAANGICSDETSQKHTCMHDGGQWKGSYAALGFNPEDETFEVGQQQKALFMPLIKQRIKLKESQDDKFGSSYIDKLLDIHLQDDENRKLDNDELTGLCSEFLNGGTHATTSTLQWMMANLEKHQHIQEKLFMEIKRVLKDGSKLVNEEELQKIPYLKAVILESLRKHTLGTFLTPHLSTGDIDFNGSKLPRNMMVYFMTDDMTMDPKVWDDPTIFRPERFVTSHENGDVINFITEKREIKMMPFGAGRRSCPGHATAMLHLEYFVANLVWCLEWKKVDGEDIDIEPKQEFVMTMKNPLKTILLPRF
ncbi:cytochrome P450 89A2-like [Hibiscus syriacus]|uniref:cytochrome P450 89A2-like n=1 Tax=Hibiscus syriacus TaxID=106335 RepID=UPI00192208CD|nr:cytochrome P450 89A2-like [Hibiscus syriacus]